MIQIENYISSFLLKNKYCAISGLGTLELKRDAAYVRPEGSKLNPPNYNITFSPIGVIDDGFATFIANHENVSISKASNDIKTFTQDVKNELSATGRFEINGVGYFTRENNTLKFFQDETLDLERDPIQLYREKANEEENEEQETLADAKSFKDLHFTHSESGVAKPKMGTLLKYLLALLLLIGLAAAAYFGYKYFEGNRTSSSTTEEAANIEDYEEIDEPADTAAIVSGSEEVVSEDSASTEAIEGTVPITAAGEFNVAVMSYNNEVSATVKSKKLITYGNKASVLQKGDRYYIVITASHTSNDTTAIKDSLRKFFNPSGTPFIVK